jgi:hypothetical protein
MILRMHTAALASLANILARKNWGIATAANNSTKPTATRSWIAEVPVVAHVLGQDNLVLSKEKFHAIKNNPKTGKCKGFAHLLGYRHARNS